MKKIGVITFHSAENSGAVLQCWALQTALKKLGAAPFVIDYQPDYARKQYQVLLNPFVEAGQRGVKGWRYVRSVLAFTIQDILFYRKLSRQFRFKRFRRKNLDISPCYDSYRQLAESPPEADVYLAGSDQIWNPFLTGGDYDPAFFLRFGSAPKYTYAVSVGKEPDETDVRQIQTLAKDISTISLREQEACERLAPALGPERVARHLDPTLLLTGEDWMPMVRPPHVPQPYILVYALERNPLFSRALEKLRQDSSMQLVDISQCNLKLPRTSCRMLDFAPDEFLSMVANANLVLTNSFHCTVFSAIFHKPFLVVPHTRSNSRISGLLAALGLEDCLLDETSDFRLPRPDWTSVEEKIARLRVPSLEYLRQIVEKG